MRKVCTSLLFISVFFCTVLFMGATVEAAPYKDKVIELKQPDNSKVQVKVSGDELYQHIEGLDGYTLCRDSKTGWICYAELNKDGSELVSTGTVYTGTNLMKKQAQLAIDGKDITAKHIEINKDSIAKKRAEVKRQLKNNGTDNMSITKDNLSSNLNENGAASNVQAKALTGNVTGLTILVDFSDEPASVAGTEIYDLLNTKGYTGYGNNGSVYDYFYDVSGGKLSYQNKVVGYYRAKKPKSYYNASSDYTRAVELVNETLAAVNSGVDYSTLTTDANRNVLSVNILYAGQPDVEWATGLWPHQGWVDFRADGVNINKYELSNIGNDLSIFTICHENGHMVCNYPDEYDYDGDSSGCGTYSLMSYTADEKNPPPPDPYLRSVVSGWNTVTSLNSIADGTTVTANASTNGTHPVYRWSGTNANEFFLVENIVRSGRYASVPDQGLLIWHIDTKGSNNYQQRTASNHYLVSVEQADGYYDLENNNGAGADGDLFHAGYKTSFNDTTAPSAKWWNGKASGLKISSIGKIGSKMTFVKGK